MRQKLGLVRGLGMGVSSALFLASMAVAPVAAAPPGGERVEVPFAFKAAETALPAGSYRVAIVTHGKKTTVLLAGKEQVELPVVTRLASVGQRGDAARLVFDKVGEERVLSEVWLPGIDGLLVQGAEAAQGLEVHEIVGGSKQN
jgi:hypothetical protein